MATSKSWPKLIVIVGPTASGKSALAMKIAKKYSGEIICADSRTIYKGMDIGTAKPTKKDRQKVPHWGLDLVNPGKRFTAYDFQRYAQAEIAAIRHRGKLPMIVGGAGLYIDGVIFDFNLSADRSVIQRWFLGLLSAQRLQNIILKKGYGMPTNRANRRHLIRSIERAGQSGSQNPTPLSSTLIIGLNPSDAVLRSRINKRVELYFKRRILDETTHLVRQYGKRAIADSAGIVYSICLEVLSGKISKNEARNLAQTAEWQYARRQRTWFKRNKYIHWFESPDDAFASVTELLNK